jgi:hypothetical protein
LTRRVFSQFFQVNGFPVQVDLFQQLEYCFRADFRREAESELFFVFLIFAFRKQLFGFQRRIARIRYDV